MNAKQFVSSTLFAGVDFGVSKIPLVGRWIAWPFRIVFPTMGYERVKGTLLRPSIFVSVYLLGVTICFVLQALLADQAGYLGTPDGNFGASPDSDGGPDRILFFDDPHNLFNYLVLVPLYLVAGAGYVISLFSLKERMLPKGSNIGFALDSSLKPILSGVFAVGVFFVVIIMTQAGYAVDIQTKSLYLFWFHGDSIDGSFNFNGYAYLIINVLLASFVIYVALLHIELFRWSSIISKGIRSYSSEADKEGIFLDNGDKLKTILAPFTETAIWSKAFAMLLAFNIYTWHASGLPLTKDTLSLRPV